MNKEFEVLIKVPDGWFDAESPIGWYSRNIRDEARRVIKEQVIEQLMSKIEVPDIEISKEEIREAVKERIVEKLADKALNSNSL